MDVDGALRDHGLRRTPQRRAVLDALMGGRAMSAQEVHEAARVTTPELGLSTVYRTLITLSEAGVVDAIGQHDGEATYRLCSGGHHHHLICDTCRRVVELSECDLTAVQDAIAAEHGFSVTGHSLTFHGVCGDCARSGSGAG